MWAVENQRNFSAAKAPREVKDLNLMLGRKAHIRSGCENQQGFCPMRRQATGNPGIPLKNLHDSVVL